MAPSLSLLFFLFLLAARADCTTFQLDRHHRFSDRLRDWARSKPHEHTLPWPEKGTPEYYNALAARDRTTVRGRSLAASPDELTFADGNETVLIRAFGSLYYAEVRLGTPNVSFLVALDTGSSLMWVPCDCKSNQSCVSLPIPDIQFNIFNSSASSTSKRVPCSSALCDSKACINPSDTCPYTIRYADNATTTGVLLEDIMYFITNDNLQRSIDTRVTFGCGQVQENEDLPTGLLGLGLERTSVPSTLVERGLTSNSFSMCFGSDGYGRISFGDKGSSDQHTTPYNSSFGIYSVTVANTLVGDGLTNVSFDAFFDSGSSFTILEDPAYSALAEKFNSLVKTRRVSFNISIPFSFCYEAGNTTFESLYPNISLIMKGGSKFDLLSPIVVLVDSDTRQTVGFCLAVLRSRRTNIIAQNFMTGYKVVFDREVNVIGWTMFDCYSDVGLKSSGPNPSPSPSPSPSPALPPIPVERGPVAGSPQEKTISRQSSSPPGLLSWCFVLRSMFPQLVCFLLSLV